MTDPFHRHPELRDRITPPASSFAREMSLEKLESMLREAGLPTGWWYSDAEREANRHAFLQGCMDRDLWVFGYGSLMWDPGIHFVEVAQAYLPDYARRFILRDVRGARGSPDRPGVMAALDHGPGCHGLAFRVARDVLEAETKILWQREKLADAYDPTFVQVDLADGTVEALTFVANHASPHIEPDLPRAAQIDHLATGEGIRGTSADYLRNVAAKFRDLGIDDPDTFELLQAVEDLIARRGAGQSR